MKSSSSTGTPCGQIDGSESLKIERGSNLTGRRFTGVRLDLEMTGDAVVKLTLEQSTSPYKKVTYQLQTGRSISSSQKYESDYDKTVPYAASSLGSETLDACAAPNSSGPNSNMNDNCQWTVIPGFDFDKATLTTSCGTVSLEGGSDFGSRHGQRHALLPVELTAHRRQRLLQHPGGHRAERHGADQRLRSRRQRAHGAEDDQPGPRHRGRQRGRHVHLHAERQLQRARLLQVQGVRRPGVLG